MESQLQGRGFPGGRTFFTEGSTLVEIDAIYQGGVLKPIGELPLRENQTVRIRIEPTQAERLEAWIARIGELQRPIIERYGCLPDSTADIAEDRRRDL